MSSPPSAADKPHSPSICSTGDDSSLESEVLLDLCSKILTEANSTIEATRSLIFNLEETLNAPLAGDFSSESESPLSESESPLSDSTSGNFFHDSHLPEFESESPLFDSDATCDFSEVPETEFQDLGRTKASGGDGLHSKADPVAVMAEETRMESTPEIFFHDSQLPEFESESPLFDSDATCDFSEVPETEFQVAKPTKASGGDGLHSKANSVAVMADGLHSKSTLPPGAEQMMQILLPAYFKLVKSFLTLLMLEYLFAHALWDCLVCCCNYLWE